MALKELLTDLSNFKYTDYDNAGINTSRTAGRHGGTTGPTPAQPPHPDEHSKFDDGVGFGVAPNDNPQSFDVRGYTITGTKTFDRPNQDAITIMTNRVGFPYIPFGSGVKTGPVDFLSGVQGSWGPETLPLGFSFNMADSLLSPGTPPVLSLDTLRHTIPEVGPSPSFTIDYSRYDEELGSQFNTVEGIISSQYTDTEKLHSSYGTQFHISGFNRGDMYIIDHPHQSHPTFKTFTRGSAGLSKIDLTSPNFDPWTFEDDIPYVIPSTNYTGPISNFVDTFSDTPKSADAHGSDFFTTPLANYTSQFSADNLQTAIDSGFNRGDMYITDHPHQSHPTFLSFTQGSAGLGKVGLTSPNFNPFEFGTDLPYVISQHNSTGPTQFTIEAFSDTPILADAHSINSLSRLTDYPGIYIGPQGEVNQLVGAPSISSNGITFTGIDGAFNHTLMRDRLYKHYQNHFLTQPYTHITLGSDLFDETGDTQPWKGGSIHIGSQDIKSPIGDSNLSSYDFMSRLGYDSYQSNVRLYNATDDTYGTTGTTVTHNVSMITLSGPTSQAYETTIDTSPISSGAHGSDFQTTPIEAYSSIFATQDGLLMDTIYDSGFNRGGMYIQNASEPFTPEFKVFTQTDKSLKPFSEWSPQKYGSNFVDTQYTFFGGEEKEFRFDDRIPYNIPARDNTVFGFDQPFILKDIGDKWGPGGLGAVDEGLFRGGFVTSAARTVADVFRLSKFILTPRGIMFGLKQAGLQLLNPRAETRTWNPLSLGSVAPMVHVDRHLGGGTYEDAIGPAGTKSILTDYGDAVVSKVPAIGLGVTTIERVTLAHIAAMVPGAGGKVSLGALPEIKFNLLRGNIDSLVSGYPLSTNPIGFDGNTYSRDSRYDEGWTFDGGISGGTLSLSGKNINKVRTFGRTPILSRTIKQEESIDSLMGGWDPPIMSPYEEIEYGETVRSPIARQRVFYNNGDTSIPAGHYAIYDTYADGEIGNRGGISRGPKVIRPEIMNGNIYTIGDQYYKHNVKYPLNNFKDLTIGKSDGKVSEALYEQTIPMIFKNTFIASDKRIYADTLNGEMPLGGNRPIRGHTNLSKIYIDGVYHGDRYDKSKPYAPFEIPNVIQDKPGVNNTREERLQKGTIQLGDFAIYNKRYFHSIGGDGPVVSIGGRDDLNQNGYVIGTARTKIRLKMDGHWSSDLYNKDNEYFPKHHSLIEDSKELDISKGKIVRTSKTKKVGTVPVAIQKQVYQIAGDTVKPGGSKYYTLSKEPPFDEDEGGLSRGDRVFEEGVFAGDFYSKDKPYAKTPKIYIGDKSMLVMGDSRDNAIQLGRKSDNEVGIIDNSISVQKRYDFTHKFDSSGGPLISISGGKTTILPYNESLTFGQYNPGDEAGKGGEYERNPERFQLSTTNTDIKQIGTFSIAGVMDPKYFPIGGGASKVSKATKKIGKNSIRYTNLLGPDGNILALNLYDGTLPYSKTTGEGESTKVIISSQETAASLLTKSRLQIHATTGDPIVTIKTKHRTSNPYVARYSTQGVYKDLKNIKLQDFPLINLTGDGNLGGENQALGFVKETEGLKGNLFGLTGRYGFGVLGKKKYTEIVPPGGDGTLQGKDTDGIPKVEKTLAYEHKFAPDGIKDIGSPDFKTIKTPKNLGTDFSTRTTSKAKGKGAALDRYKTLAYGDIPKSTDDSEKYGKKTTKTDKGGQYAGQAKDISSTGLVYKIDSEGKLGLVKKGTDDKYMYGQGTGIGEPDKVNMHPYGDDDINPDDDYIKFKFKDLINNKYIIFRAFLSGISESLTPEWSSERYIGRPDSVHVYQGVDRSMSFEFMVVPSSKQELPILWEKLNYLVGLTYPSWKKVGDGKRMEAPFIQLTIGDMYNDVPGFFSSLSVTVDDNSPWEIEDGLQLPHAINVSCEFTHIGQHALASEGTHFDFGGKAKSFLKPYNQSTGKLDARKKDWDAVYNNIGTAAANNAA